MQYHKLFIRFTFQNIKNLKSIDKYKKRENSTNKRKQFNTKHFSFIKYHRWINHIKKYIDTIKLSFIY